MAWLNQEAVRSGIHRRLVAALVSYLIVGALLVAGDLSGSFVSLDATFVLAVVVLGGIVVLAGCMFVVPVVFWVLTPLAILSLVLPLLPPLQHELTYWLGTDITGVTGVLMAVGSALLLLAYAMWSGIWGAAGPYGF